MTNFWNKVQIASSQKVYRAWVMSTVLGMWLGYILAGPLYFLLSVLLPSSTAATALFPLYALISGLIIGTCQWGVLRHHFKKAYWWIVATGLGNFFAVVLLEPLFNVGLQVFADPSIWDIAPLFESRAAHNITEALAAGVCVGIAQWLYLKTRLPKTTAWIAVVAGAFVLTLVVLLVPIPEFQSSAPGGLGVFNVLQPPRIQLMSTAFHVARIGLSGIIQAGITGIWMADFVARTQ